MFMLNSTESVKEGFGITQVTKPNLLTIKYLEVFIMETIKSNKITKEELEKKISRSLMPELKREFCIYHNTNKETMFRDTPLKDGEKRDFKYIGAVMATDINEAWKLAQNDFNEDYAQFGVRSTCVGDMILDGNDFYLIKMVGFEYMLSIDSEGGE